MLNKYTFDLSNIEIKGGSDENKKIRNRSKEIEKKNHNKEKFSLKNSTLKTSTWSSITK